LLLLFCTNQFCRDHALATLLSSLPIWPQMLPALQRLRERVFTNMSHQFEFTITPASFNGSKAANLQ
jgi:hypothetical protein